MADMQEDDHVNDMVTFPRNFKKDRRCSVSAESMTPGEQQEVVTEKIVIPKPEEAYTRIARATQGNLLFRNLDAEQRKEVFDAMFERKVEAGEVVIQQGDEGDNFYVIDSGLFEVFVKQPNEPEAKKVLEVKAGDSFGELALLYNAPRAATVRAITSSVLWAVDRVTFRRILMDTTFRKRKLYESFLAEVPILMSLTQHERSKVADALEPVEYADGETIVTQGDNNSECFYIIEDGTCVVKKVFGDSKEPREVLRLSRGQYFGEIALLMDQPRAATVQAVGRVKCIVLDRKSFQRLLGNVKEILQRNMENYKQFEDAIAGGRLT
eukprot:Colp12_sorted_trinity150504_noHs@20802